MKKIYESEYNGWNESCEKLHVYELENDEEFFEIDEMNHDERCEMCGVANEYGVPPGAAYHTYEFVLTGTHFIMIENFALNI